MNLGRIATLGSLLGIKTTNLLARLDPLSIECAQHLVATIPHGFDALAVTTRAARAKARTICGAWLDALPGDELELELDATSVTARSDEAALPATAPLLVHTLGDDLVALGFDGASWTYVIAQANADASASDATSERIDRVAATLGVTEAQRRVATGLHRSLAREQPSRAWVRTRAGSAELAPIVGLAWDRVEWQPIQSMLAGFYPSLGAVGQIARLARAAEVEHATVELVLGPTDPPAMRIAMRLEG